MQVFEGGIVATERSDSAPSGLRLIATDELPIYSQTSTTLIDMSGGSLSARLAVVLSPNHAHRNAEYYEEKDTRYALRACAYHVERLATLYADHAQRFEQQERRQAARHGERAASGATDEQRIYFEADAFFGAARGFYEHLRRVLWKHFGDSGTRPRSFERVLQSESLRLPEPYASTVNWSWKKYGTKLKEYRDSTFHNDPLNQGHTNVLFIRVGQRWGMKVALPENPEVKSRDRFRFEEGPDVLSYCHEVLCHFVELAEMTARATGLRTSEPDSHPRPHREAG